MKKRDIIKLSNDRVLQVHDNTVIAWSSAGAMEREDRSQIIATFHADPAYPLISRTEAERLTGISAQTIRFAGERGDVEEVRIGNHILMTLDSLLQYAGAWPHFYARGGSGKKEEEE